MRTDAELVEMARQGDAGARDELVRLYQRQTALLAAALVGDLAEGEDLGQEAFVRAFGNLDLLVDPSRFGPWLRRIAFGASIDWLRSFRPDLYRGSEEEVAPVRDPGPSRHVKVAERLGLPVGTVRSLVTRARQKLAPLLADHAPEALSHVDELFQEQKMPDSPTRRFLHVANGDTRRVSTSRGSARERRPCARRQIDLPSLDRLARLQQRGQLVRVQLDRLGPAAVGPGSTLAQTL